MRCVGFAREGGGVAVLDVRVPNHGTPQGGELTRVNCVAFGVRFLKVEILRKRNSCFLGLVQRSLEGNFEVSRWNDHQQPFDGATRRDGGSGAIAANLKPGLGCM